MGVWPALDRDRETVTGLLRSARERQRTNGPPVWQEIDPGEIA